MKNLINILFSTLLLLVFAVGCDSEDELLDDRKAEIPAPAGDIPLTGDAGSADFSNFISIGNSVTAGFMDGALYNRGQQNSFPNLLAQRFALDGGGDFVQPDIDTDNGFNASFNNLADAFTGPATFGKLVLDLSIPGPVPTTPGDVLNMVPPADRPNVDNLAVPGMRLIEMSVDNYGTLNPYFARFSLDPNEVSVVEQAIAKAPTFMSFWLGNNDALSWATGGGIGPDGQDESGNPNGQDANPSALVSEFSFNQALQGNLGALFGTYPNLQGVIINVPNITLIPYFQAVQWNAIPLDAATAEAANGGYAGYNQFLDGLVLQGFMSEGEAADRKVNFVAGNNAIVIEDDQLTDITPFVEGAFAAQQINEAQRAALLNLKQARQTKNVAGRPELAAIQLPAEIITLAAGAVLGTEAIPGNPASIIGVGVPLGDQYTLTADELIKLVTRITAFNTIISNYADSNPNLHLIDANAIYLNIALGNYVSESGFNYAPDFSPNGVFSVDGIHPNPAGHAILTNAILEVINDEFGADLPLYDPVDFSTVLSN